mgnify:CR=1 FL=1
MNIQKTLIASAMSLMLAMPGLASATLAWNDQGGEAGFVDFPDHVKSIKTRAEVLRELDVARKDGSFWYLQIGLPITLKSVGPGKTREEVRNEVLNMTLDERRQFQMIGGR